MSLVYNWCLQKNGTYDHIRSNSHNVWFRTTDARHYASSNSYTKRSGIWRAGSNGQFSAIPAYILRRDEREEEAMRENGIGYGSGKVPKESDYFSGISTMINSLQTNSYMNEAWQMQHMLVVWKSSCLGIFDNKHEFPVVIYCTKGKGKKQKRRRRWRNNSFWRLVRTYESL